MKINNKFFYFRVVFGNFRWTYYCLRGVAKHNLALGFILITFMPKFVISRVQEPTLRQY